MNDLVGTREDPASLKVKDARPGCWHLNYFRQKTYQRPSPQLAQPELASGSLALKGLTHSLGHQIRGPHLRKRLRSYF